MSGMRDVVAALLAIALVIVALRLATSLTKDRRRRQQQRRALEADGQTILAEVPTDTGLTFFTEDPTAFHFGDRAIPKGTIKAARVLINGAPIAVSVIAGYAAANAMPNHVIEDRPEGLARDRWDVSIETADDTAVVPCGAIRERISQELARRIFGAVKREIESGGR